MAHPAVSYAGTFFAAAGIYPSTALALSWPANNVSGQTKRATANAMQISIGNLGAVLGTQLYRPATAPRYVLGHSFALGYLVCNVLVVITLWVVLARENSKREHGTTGVEVAALESGSESGVGTTNWKGDDDPKWRFNV